MKKKATVTKTALTPEPTPEELELIAAQEAVVKAQADLRAKQIAQILKVIKFVNLNEKELDVLYATFAHFAHTPQVLANINNVAKEVGIEKPEEFSTKLVRMGLLK